MIFQTISYTNNDGTTLAIGETVYPAKNFEMPMYSVNDPVKKVQFPGRWPSFSYPEFREIHVQGDILGNDASDYNDKERAMRSCIQPPYRQYTGRRHGTVFLTFYGDAATYYAYVILASLDIPKEANFPSVGSYELTWTSFEPYLFDVATGIPTTAY